MYLAKHVGGWSSKIGRFYNGRHHTTVLHAIAKVERLRKADQAFDALLDVLTATLASEGEARSGQIVSPPRRDLIDAVASRVIQRLKETNHWNGASCDREEGGNFDQRHIQHLIKHGTAFPGTDRCRSPPKSGFRRYRQRISPACPLWRSGFLSHAVTPTWARRRI
jgi:hypothetical protein